MKKLHVKHQCILCILALLLLSSPLIANATYPVDANKDNFRILFISSYSYSWGSIPYQIDGLSESLNTHQYIVNYEFMDTKNTNYSNQYEEFYQFLKYKLEKRPPYDGVIVGDDAALQFMNLYKEELFPNIPIVFEGIDNVEMAKNASKHPQVTGVVEKVDYATNLELAHSLFPAATHLVLIFDNTESGVGIANQLKQVSGLFDNYEVEHLNTSEYTKEEFIQKLEKYDENSIVFGISIGEQKGNINYTEDERSEIIRKHANVPVFSITQAGVDRGILGGYVINHQSAGYLAGEMMKSILEKNIVPEIELHTPSSYYFNYSTMKKFGIKASDLPVDSEIINKPENFFRKHATWIISLLSAGLVTIILAYYFRRKANERLQVAYDQLVAAEANLKVQYEHNKKYTEILEKQEAQIRHQADYDYLTNLPNRRAVMNHIDELLKENIDYTVMIIDIDDFKEINDTYGHASGDRALHVLSTRFLTLMEDDRVYVSRFGGDEFLVIIKEVEISDNCSLLTSIKEVFLEPIMFGDIAYYVKKSIGIANSKDRTEQTTDIVSNADIALYEAKKLGKNGHVYYSPIMREKLIKTKNIRDVLSEACDTDGFHLLFQPQVNVRTGRTYGYEALVRLQDHSISPAQFIPVAEETDLIIKIGRIVAQKAVEQLVDWRERGFALRPIAINFSTKQIRDKEYVSYLKNLLQQHEISPKLIEIEFTESIFIDNSKKAAELFEDFLAIGVDLALDDFGTGYSSISYLTYIPVKKIKLDKSFVDIYLQDEKSQFIENIIRLSHSLGLKITVEGVEERHQYEKLKIFNCDYIQGYYFSKPITGKEIEQLTDPIVRK